MRYNTNVLSYSTDDVSVLIHAPMENLDIDFTPEERQVILQRLNNRFYVNPDPITHMRLVTWAYCKNSSKTQRSENLLDKSIQDEAYEKELQEFCWVSGLTKQQVTQQALLKLVGEHPKFEGWRRDPDTNLYFKK